MTDDDICEAEQSIERQLAALAQELYNDLYNRVSVGQEDQVTTPNHLLENAIDYLTE